MLRFNGLQFAMDNHEMYDREMWGAYFESGSPPDGWCTIERGRTVVLYDTVRRPIAWIKPDGLDNAFAGTAQDCDGHVRYMPELASYTARALGLDELTPSRVIEELLNALDSVGIISTTPWSGVAQRRENQK